VGKLRFEGLGLMSSEMITFWEWATVAAVALPVLLGLFDEWNHERSKRLPTARR
tara:strand:- start:284 stop:445 length:162 start_codon:yes stop_codon:yes gene_type:complete